MVEELALRVEGKLCMSVDPGIMQRHNNVEFGSDDGKCDEKE